MGIYSLNDLYFSTSANRPYSKIFLIEGDPAPLINVIYCIFISLWRENLEKYVMNTTCIIAPQ